MNLTPEKEASLQARRAKLLECADLFYCAPGTVAENLYRVSAAAYAAGYSAALAEAPQPPVPQPLSDAEIVDLLPDWQSGWGMRDYGMWVARAIERAHGIGEPRAFHSEIAEVARLPQGERDLRDSIRTMEPLEFWGKAIAPVLNQALNSVCRKCGGEMRPGKYTEQTYRGSPDLPGQTGNEAGCTISPAGPGKLSDCSAKFTKCGWSVR